MGTFKPCSDEEAIDRNIKYIEIKIEELQKIVKELRKNLKKVRAARKAA